MQRHPLIYFGPSSLHRRGVMTAGAIGAGSVIEICPMLVLSTSQLERIHHSELHDYYFLWGEGQDQPAIALGYGSLYNHSPHPNATFSFDYQDETMLITSIRDIQEGEEITLNYHEGLQQEAVWFSVNAQS